MRLLGVDCSSFSTGFAILEYSEKKIKLIDFGEIKPNPKKEFYEKVGEIFLKIERLIKEYSPHSLIIEDIFLSKNVKSAFKLGEIRGAVITCAFVNGLNIKEYSPATIKHTVTGYGRADKEQVSYMVEKILNFKTKGLSSDVTDAIAIALTAILRGEIDDS